MIIRENFGLAISLSLCATSVPSEALAQYREGQPPTLSAPTRPPNQESIVTSDFARVNRAAGSPRIVIFWNRDFTDEVTSSYSEVTEYGEKHNVDEVESTEETAGPAGSMRIRERNLEETTKGRRIAGEERDVAKRDTLVSESIDWDLEGGFNRTLSGAGAKLVDRTSILRTQGAEDGAQERANVQAVETRAITGKADILVEILRTKDQRAADGITFRIIARDVRNATVLADFTTSGRPPIPRMGLVAGPDGFERANPPEPRPEDIGRQLAVELMQAMLSKMR